MLIELLFHRIALTRPQEDAVHGNFGEFADAFEIVRFRNTIRTEKAARKSSFHGFPRVRGHRQFGVNVSLLQHRTPEFPLRREDRFVRPDGRLRLLVPRVKHGSPCGFSPRRRFGPSHTPLQTISFAVRPAPPVEETNLMRKNLVCTPVTVRASPAVFVVVSIVWYSASISAMAPCNTRLTAVGAVPKIVCQRTAVPVSACPA